MGRLRLTSGRFGGRWIVAAPESRPTQERVREALLSRWSSRLDEGSVLDLCCGSGAVALESLSRGARNVYMADASPAAIAVVQENIGSLDLDPTEAQVAVLELPLAPEPKADESMGGDRFKGWPRAWPNKFDLVFADPPYAFERLDDLSSFAFQLLHRDGELCVEHGSRVDLGRPDGARLVDRRTYGESALSFFQANG